MDDAELQRACEVRHYVASIPLAALSDSLEGRERVQQPIAENRQLPGRHRHAHHHHDDTSGDLQHSPRPA